jgi:hypothetical protein
MTTEDITYLVNQLRGHARFHIEHCRDESCSLSVYELKIVARKLITHVMMTNCSHEQRQELYKLTNDWPS